MTFLETHPCLAIVQGEIVGYFSDVRCAAKTAVFHARNAGHKNAMVSDGRGVQYGWSELVAMVAG